MQPRRSMSDWVDGNDEKDGIGIDDGDDVGYSDTATTSTGDTEAAAAAVVVEEVTMDDYFFKDFVRGCRNVAESTSYLEIFNYSVRFHVPGSGEGS